MTDEQHAYWLAYFRHLADNLGLRDWRILLWRDPVPDVVACVGVTDGAKECVVNFGHSWWNTTPDRQRQTAIHELLHAHHQEISERVSEASEKFGDNSLMQYLPSLVRHEIEHVVDAIAEVIAPFFPLPEAA